jgi:hypothetical protein
MEIIIAEKHCRANNQSALNKLKSFIENHRISDDASEPQVRQALLPFVEQDLGINEWILYDGNSIWDVKRLVKQFRTFIKFYDYKHFTSYLYDFFHLQCGSIAHYNKAGWLSTYPDLDSLKEFFKRNEYGSEVQFYPPEWHYDARQAVEQMATILFGTGSRHGWPQF